MDKKGRNKAMHEEILARGERKRSKERIGKRERKKRKERITEKEN